MKNIQVATKVLVKCPTNTLYSKLNNEKGIVISVNGNVAIVNLGTILGEIPIPIEHLEEISYVETVKVTK
jgi:hypothetical protein